MSIDAEYVVEDDFYKITLDDTLSFNLSKEFDESVIIDLISGLKDGSIGLFYKDECVSVESAKEIIGNISEDNMFHFTFKDKADDVEYLECPYCLRFGLRLYDYDGDEVYECDLCGAEIWFWQKKGIEETCREIKRRSE